MTEFGFDIEESWRVVKKVLDGAVLCDCTEGVVAIRERWAIEKAPLLKLLGPTGRICATVATVFDGLADRADAVAIGSAGELAALDYIYSTALGESEKQKLIGAVHVLFSALSLGEVADNKLKSVRADCLVADKVVPAGTKVGKYTRMYAEHVFSGDPMVDVLAETLVVAMSRATEAVRVKQNMVVVLSVNPLDMLLASECTTSWSSCHSLYGSSSTGPLAYMLDGVTAIAYSYTALKEYAGVLLPKKMWRQMVHLDLEHGGAIISKEYPSAHAVSAAKTRKQVADVLARHIGMSKAEWKVFFLRNQSNLQSTDQNGHYVRSSCNWVYCDAPTARVRLNNGTAPAVSVGAKEIPCVVCGTLRETGKREFLMCQACGDYVEYYCVRCGMLIQDDDYYTGLDDECYCGECYAETFATCCDCGATLWREDAKHYCNSIYCEECYEVIQRDVQKLVYWCAPSSSMREVPPWIPQ